MKRITLKDSEQGKLVIKSGGMGMGTVLWLLLVAFIGLDAYLIMQAPHEDPDSWHRLFYFVLCAGFYLIAHLSCIRNVVVDTLSNKILVFGFLNFRKLNEIDYEDIEQVKIYKRVENLLHRPSCLQYFITIVANDGTKLEILRSPGEGMIKAAAEEIARKAGKALVDRSTSGTQGISSH